MKKPTGLVLKHKVETTGLVLKGREETEEGVFIIGSETNQRISIELDEEGGIRVVIEPIETYFDYNLNNGVLHVDEEKNICSAEKIAKELKNMGFEVKY